MLLCPSVTAIFHFSINKIVLKNVCAYHVLNLYCAVYVYIEYLCRKSEILMFQIHTASHI